MDEKLDKFFDITAEVLVDTIIELLEDEEKEKEFLEKSDEFKNGYRYALTILERIDSVISERDNRQEG